MLDILKRKQEYISCEWLEYGMHFAVNGLYYCDKYAHHGGNNEPVSSLKNDSTYDFKDFSLKRKKDIQKVRKGRILDRCKDCYLLKKSNWCNDNKIKHLAISTNLSCNSNCIYCFSHLNKKFFNSLKDIPIYYYLKKCIEKKIINSDCEIQFGGGEPLLNKEFDLIMKLFKNNNFYNISLYSSGIKYSPIIEEFLKNDMLKSIIISPDAGNRDLYKKIKSVDKFETVWQNIKKYAIAQGKNKSQVKVKYIIIPGINDNIKNIEEFIEQAKSCSVNYVLIDVEKEWYKNNYKSEQKVRQLFKLVRYFEKYTEKSCLNWGHNSSVCCAIEDYHSLYDDTF